MKGGGGLRRGEGGGERASGFWRERGERKRWKERVWGRGRESGDWKSGRENRSGRGTSQGPKKRHFSIYADKKLEKARCSLGFGSDGGEKVWTLLDLGPSMG